MRKLIVLLVMSLTTICIGKAQSNSLSKQGTVNTSVNSSVSFSDPNFGAFGFLVRTPESLYPSGPNTFYTNQGGDISVLMNVSADKKSASGYGYNSKYTVYLQFIKKEGNLIDYYATVWLN